MGVVSEDLLSIERTVRDKLPSSVTGPGRAAHSQVFLINHKYYIARNNLTFDSKLELEKTKLMRIRGLDLSPCGTATTLLTAGWPAFTSRVTSPSCDSCRLHQ